MRFSTISLILLGIFLALQTNPVTGIILMLFGGPIWSGILINLFLIALAIEALNRSIPRVFVAIPILVYGSFYGLYISQSLEISAKERELQATNASGLMTFNPDSQDLVMRDAGSFVSSYRIPVVYDPGENSGPRISTEYRLLSKAACALLNRDPTARVTSFTPQNGWDRSMPCVVGLPSQPKKDVVTAQSNSVDSRKSEHSIQEQSYRIQYNGKILGEYRQAYISRYSFIPFPVIGCGLDSGSPAWRCFSQLQTTHYNLDTRPPNSPEEYGNNPVAIMLSIPAYTQVEKDNFTGSSYDKQVISQAANMAAESENKASLGYRDFR